MEGDHFDPSNQLIQLEDWLKTELDSSVRIQRGRCRQSDRNFIDVTNQPKEMTFLATFHLIFSLTSESSLQLHLVAFNGKIIDACSFDLVRIIDAFRIVRGNGPRLSEEYLVLYIIRNMETLKSGNESLGIANFIKRFAHDRLILCRGIKASVEENSEKNLAGNSKFELLADFIDEKVVYRDPKCKFALLPEEGEVCEHCKNAESAIISGRASDSFHLANVKSEPEEEEENTQASSLLELTSSYFMEENFFPSVKIEEDCRTSRRKRRRKNHDDVTESNVDAVLSQRRLKRVCLLCHQSFPDVESQRLHLKENPDCKHFQRNQRKKRREKRIRRSNSCDAICDPDQNSSGFKKKCSICLDVYTLEKNYLYDQSLHEKVLKDLDSPVVCPICSAPVDQRRNLNLHFDQEHSNNTGEWSLDRAMCCECFAVVKRRSLKLHQRVKHEQKSHEKTFLCTVCGKQSSSKQIHEIHLARKHRLARDGISPPLSQVCDQCGRSYVSIDLLKQHISSMHRARERLRCDDCSKTFYSMSALVTHRVCLHLKIFPFKCRLCKYKAGDLSGVYRHCENSHGFRGKRENVNVDLDDLKKIRDICQFNYFGNVG